MKRLLMRHAPWWAKRGARYALYSTLDALDGVRGGRPEMVPPRVVQLVVGSGDFIAQGKQIAAQLVDPGGLKPTDRVLEIGSGYGRVARGLTEVLTTGSYDGVEILRAGVEWSQREITSRFSDIRFHHAHLANAYVRTVGASAASYVFPFESESFDFVFLTSVFTHMQPPEIARYMQEIGRLLRKGGRVFSTFYLLDPFNLAQIESGASSFAFPHQFDGFRAERKDQPEAALALPIEDVHRMHADAGLQIVAPIRFGNWSGRSEYLTWQDAVIAERA